MTAPESSPKPAEAIARDALHELESIRREYELSDQENEANLHERSCIAIILEAAAAINDAAAIQRGDGLTDDEDTIRSDMRAILGLVLPALNFVNGEPSSKQAVDLVKLRLAKYEGEIANLKHELACLNRDRKATPPAAKPNETSGATPEISDADLNRRFARAFWQSPIDERNNTYWHDDDKTDEDENCEWKPLPDFVNCWSSVRKILAASDLVIKPDYSFSPARTQRERCRKIMLAMLDLEAGKSGTAELAAVRKSAGAEGASGIVEQAIEEILKPEGPTRRQYLEEHDYQKAVRLHAYRIDKATSVILSKLAAAKSTPGVADEMLEWLLKKDAHLTTDQGCGDGPSEWGVSVPYGNRNDMSFRSYTGSTPRDAIARAMEGEKLRAVKQEQIGGAT